MAAAKRYLARQFQPRKTLIPMKMPAPFKIHLTSALALVLAAGVSAAFAGPKDADKEVAEQAKAPFPVHFSLSAGYDSSFEFRGVNILPEQTLNLFQANVQTINSIPGFQSLINSLGATTEDFVKSLGSPSKIEVARHSDIGYFEGNVSAYGLTAGAFYAMQNTRRIEPNFFGRKSFFNEYRELDAYLNYAHAFGPVYVTLGGTYYHVEKNTQFDTAEMNFGISYTPPQFQYVTASFSYDYSGSLHYTDYLDGHHLELRVSGNVPVVKNWVSVNPYVSISAGSGIIPRAFSLTTLPTFFSTKAYAAGLRPSYEAIYTSFVTGNPNVSPTALANARAAFDPATLDRDFDFSNFQTGVKVPIFLGRYVTLTGDGSYSHPLGNLRVFPVRPEGRTLVRREPGVLVLRAGRAGSSKPAVGGLQTGAGLLNCLRALPVIHLGSGSESHPCPLLDVFGRRVLAGVRSCLGALDFCGAAGDLPGESQADCQ